MPACISFLVFQAIVRTTFQDALLALSALHHVLQRTFIQIGMIVFSLLC